VKKRMVPPYNSFSPQSVIRMSTLSAARCGRSAWGPFAGQPRYGSHPLCAFGSLDAHCGQRWVRDCELEIRRDKVADYCQLGAVRRIGPGHFRVRSARPESTRVP
jgi:hypothetical protein